jgi:hypothetical protein
MPLDLGFQDIATYLMEDLRPQETSYHSASTYVGSQQSGSSFKSLGDTLMRTGKDSMLSKLHWLTRNTNLIGKLVFRVILSLQ